MYNIKCIKSLKTFLSNDIHVKYCSAVIEAELTVYQIPTKTCQGNNLYLKHEQADSVTDKKCNSLKQIKVKSYLTT